MLHKRLNTKQMLFKRKIVETDKCLYSANIIDSTFHSLIEFLKLLNCGGNYLVFITATTVMMTNRPTEILDYIDFLLKMLQNHVKRSDTKYF